MGFPSGFNSKEFASNAGYTGDMGLIPGLGKTPGGGNGNPLQSACLKNPSTEEPGGLRPRVLQRVIYD